MSDDNRIGDGNRVLDTNLQRLIAVAPERARLDDAARERMSAALRARVAGESGARSANAAGATSAPPVLRALQHPVARLTALAAAVALMVLGVRGLTPGEGEVQVAGGGNTVSSGAAGGPTTVEPDDATHTGAIEADTLEPIAALEPTRSGRTEAGGDGGSDVGVAAGGGAADPVIEPGSIQAQLTIDASVASLPDQVTVWVKPMVDLPQVADPVAHTVDLVWAESEERHASFVLSGALEPARAMGADGVLLQIEAAGAAPSRIVASFEEIDRAALNFVLTAGVKVDGFVVDARTGTPVGGAFVVAIDQLPLDAITVAPTAADAVPRPYATADANGAFSLPHVMPAATVQIRASHAGFAPATVRVHLGSEAPAPLRLELPQGGAVTGLVEHPDGTRWEGALVIASSQTTDPTARPRPVMTAGLGLTDASGEYRIEDLPSGPYVVLLFGAPTSETPSPIGFTQAIVRGTDDVTVNFLAAVSAAGPSFVGVLLGEDGQPIAGAAVTLTGATDGTASRHNWRATDTDVDGSFVFVDIDSGPYVLHLATESFMRMDLLWHGTIDGPIERTIVRSGASWTLKCMGVADGDPRAGAWVIAEIRDEEASRWNFGGRGTTDADGVITFPHLPAGRYRATISGVGPGDGHLMLDAVELFAGTPTESIIAVPEGNPLFVRVLGGADGSPVEGATVVIRDSNGITVPQPQQAKTDARGVARSLSVAYGDVSVIVRTAEGLRTVVLLDFRAGGPGQPDPLDVVVQ